jgi:hypothetical protein
VTAPTDRTLVAGAGPSTRSVGAFRCSDAAHDRGDPLLASAPPARRWLLLEHPGPWGPRGLWDVVDHRVASDLLTEAAAAGARVLLIRGAGRRRSQGWRWFVADTTPGAERMVSGVFGWLGDLRGTDFTDPPGRVVRDPLFLTCTHSRHDVCCAVRGRPVAEAFQAARPAQAWECTHVGGCRFAANTVVLPYGLYYGYLDAADAAGVVAATEAGRLVLPHFRGRAGTTPVEQAAEHALRTARGLDRIDAVRVASSRRLDDGPDGARWAVELLAAGTSVDAAVVTGHQPVDTPLTCAGSRTSAYATYAVTLAS